jgi:cell division septation protein DedD
MASARHRQLAFLGLVALALAGCEAGTNPFKSGAATDAAPDAAAAPARAGRTAAADVEAPEIFTLTAQGLWDGRPSLGGVWVATADAKDPERVIIRNDATGETVIGALFRRERENPGPPIQISSDAAEALGLLAGQPAKVTVTALRREDDAPPTSEPAAATAGAEPAAPAEAEEPAVTAAPAALETGTLETGAVAAAIDKAEAKPPVMEPDAMAKAAPAAPAAGGTSYIQLGIFSVEANAKRAADTVSKAGAPAVVRKEESKGKPYWSVVAGPAGSAADREALMKKIKDLGFADAYFVSR